MMINRENHFCSQKCSNQSFIQKKKAQETSIKNYGVSHPMKSKDFVKNQYKNYEEIHGYKHPRKNPSVIEKIKNKTIATNQKKLGVNWPFQSLEIRNKSKITNQEKYGVDWAIQNPIVFEKFQNSSTKRFQIEHWKTHKILTCTANYELAFVNWCNFYQIDFDWQIRHKIDDSSKYYFIDAYIKDGQFANTWVEIKGSFRGKVSKEKWEWFHQKFPNSELWNFKKLETLNILVKGKPNENFSR